MGRKPNALIHEFFNRGAKLEDSSNRYQHTCKSCGEKFPKGRIDSLTNHLIKNCPAVSQSDRQRAILSLNQKAIQAVPYHQPAVEFTHDHPPTTDPSFAAHSSMSALETLAEVSRQHLDSTGQYDATNQNSKKRKRGTVRKEVEQPQPILPADLLIQDSHFLGLAVSNPGNEATEFAYSSMTREPAFGMPPSSDMNDFASVLRSMDQLTSDQNFVLATTSAEQAEQSMNAPTAQMMPNHEQIVLAAAASAATEIMPKLEIDEDPSDALQAAQAADGSSFFQYTMPDEPAMIDPQLQDENHPNQSISQMQMQMQMQAPVMQAMTLQPRPSSVNPSLPHAPYLHDFRLNGDPHKSKTRGRFTPNRRKEVQEVRRQGACIRCRMLKKPCSGGTPCSTCINVESARLWKSPCMRARIADEFDLYSAGLNNVIAFHEVNDVKSRISFPQTTHTMEATHLPGSEIAPAVLHTIRGLKVTSPTTDATVIGFEDPNQAPTVDVELLNQDVDSIPQSLDQYIRRVSRSIFEKEPSHFMRLTLSLAAELAASKSDALLTRALDLWTGTVILVDPNIHWNLSTISYTNTATDINLRRTDNIALTSPLSYKLMTHQLRGHIEKRCSLFAKSLMNDLERRLLQRGHASGYHFETFLTSIILLNCVEKMCWLFRTWAVNRNPDDHQAATTNGHTTDMLENPDQPSWPLDRDPQSYVVKGDSVADVVSMLLRMRAVPPSTVVGEDGIVHFDASASAGKIRDAALPQQQPEPLGIEQNVAVAAWFERVALKVEDLVKARDEPVWDAADCRCWDLKYVSRLVLPEG